MNKIFKSFISQENINKFYHLPKSVLANVIHNFPTKDLVVIGVTGTDGKTTTTNMIYEILKAAGKKVSIVSTVNAKVAGKTYDTGFHVTSPDSYNVQKFAKMAREKGEEYLVLEVTSHGLDQFRFWGIKFDIGVITNITHEHLDYHKSFDKYLDTKLKLIKSVNFAIINEGLLDKVKNKTSGKIVTFGLDKGDFNQRDFKLNLKILGDYNIENALASLAVAFTLNIDRSIAQKTLEKFTGVKGRMESVKNNKGLKIIIDFAHTPNGLEKALTALKNPEGRLISLIGAEGFRDVGKRAMMGEIAQKLSDIVIVTSVDPRGQLGEINEQITKGAEREGAKLNINFFVIDDREKAIDFAINSLSRKGDTIGIFGKGHENSMNLNGKSEVEWSDFEAVQKVLNG